MTDVNYLITDHLDIWTEATEKKSSAGRGNASGCAINHYGLKKLRELILELAIRGKLVNQVLASSEYLTDRKQTVRLRSDKANEYPFELPIDWKWTKLGRIAEINGGFAFKSSRYSNEGIRVIRISDFDELGFKDAKVVRHPFTKDLNRFKLEKNNILLAMTGGTVGKSFLVETLPEDMVVNQRVATIKIQPGSVPAFVNIVVRSNLFQSRVQDAKNSTNDNISMRDITEFDMPLPTAEEQARIVAKVDELMGLCDALERQAEDSLKAHQTLVETCLATLTNSQSPEELTQNWTRIEAHFDTLFTTEESVKALEDSIFELAIRGVLVKQSEADESATVFLERLGLVSGSANNLPSGWATCSLGNLGKISGGGTPRKSTVSFWNGSIPWISPKDMKVDYISDATDKITEAAVAGSSVKIIEPFSLLFVVRGMILAHSFPVAITETKVTINQDMKAIDLSEFDRAYVLLMMKGLKREILSLVERSSHGTCKLVSDKLWSVELPLPPREEQTRIADKVRDLTKMCNNLRHCIKTAAKKKIELSDTLTSKIH